MDNKFLLIFGVFGEYIFFTILMLLGLQYNGSNESSIYQIYWFMICFAVLLKTFRLLIGNYRKKQKLVYSLLVIFSIYLIVYGISFVLYPSYDINIQYSFFFIAFCVPSFLIGVMCSEIGYRIYLGKTIIKFIPIGTVALFINIWRLSEFQYMQNAGGLSRLSAGYMAVQLFAITVTILISKNKLIEEILPPYLKKNNRKVTLLTLILLQLTVVFFSASRGPVVALLFILYSQVMIFGQVEKKEKVKHFVLAILFAITFYLVVFRVDIEMFNVSLERIRTLFIPSENSDISNGRVALYSRGIQLFKEKPFFGQGPMGFLLKSGFDIYPHNILIELLSDYGLFGSILWGVFFIYIFKKYRYTMKYDGTSNLVFPIFLVKMLEHTFSGSFMTSGQFWFFIGFALFLPKVKANISFQKNEVF